MTYYSLHEAESAIYSVSDGLLQQRTFGVYGNHSYLYPKIGVTGGPFTPDEDLSIEARLRVINIDGEAGAYFQAFDGTKSLTASFREDGVSVFTDTGPVIVPVDVFTFHTYRLESSANSGSVRLFIDGSLAFSGIAESWTGLNGFDFGDGNTPAGNGADVDYDFIRVSSRVAEVPEPASLTLLGLGSLGLLAVRRRRQSGD